MRDLDRLRQRITLALASLPFWTSPLLQGCAPSASADPAPAGGSVVGAPLEAGQADDGGAQDGDEEARPLQRFTQPAGVVFWCGDRATLTAASSQPVDAATSCPQLTMPEVSEQAQGRLQSPGRFVEQRVVVDPTLTGALREQQGVDACCYRVVERDVPRPARGRPLRDGAVTLLAQTVAGEAWRGQGQGAPTLEGLDAARRWALAAGWLEDAQAEHGSVAAFARLTLDLQALGAPPELVADALQAGLDEVRHAQRCYALASAFAGAPLSAGRLPMPAPREVDFATLVRETFVEACVGEAASVLCAMRARARCEDAATRVALDAIIDDETRHAAFAWRVVAWGLSAGGQPARAALLEAVVEVCADMDLLEAALAEPPASPADPTLAAFGRLDARADQVAALDTWRGVVVPTLTALLGVRATASLRAAALA